MKRELTPENIQELKENQIFVFGSNMNGNHAGGAARLAVEKFGAIMGQHQPPATKVQHQPPATKVQHQPPARIALLLLPDTGVRLREL